MIKRDIKQLAVYQVEKETEVLSLECLKSLYLEKTSEIIYINKKDKLYGIICIGEIFQNSFQGKVRINRDFTCLSEYNLVKAHRIFLEKRSINKIPLVDKQGKLLGDYSRWDDKLYIERNQNQECFIKREVVKDFFKNYKEVYIIEPIRSLNKTLLLILNFLNKFEIQCTVLNKLQVIDKLKEKSICIFVDEDEKRGVQCLCRIDCLNDERRFSRQLRLCMITFKSLWAQIMRIGELDRLGIDKLQLQSFNKIDEKTTLLFDSLIRKGIRCFRLYKDEYKLTAYGKKFNNKVRERLSIYPINPESTWPKKNENSEFYSELYQNEDYEREVAQKEIFDANSVFGYQKNIKGKYFNAKNGKRITCFQPKDYIGTIYCLGPCTILGGFVEDQYTIESYLQKKLLQNGYPYRVENYGTTLRSDAAIDCRLQEIGEFSVYDIVIVLSRKGEIIGIPGSSLEKFFERHQISTEWVTDSFMHCNHKANQLIADNLLDIIEPYLFTRSETDCTEKIKVDFHSIMKNYVKHKYINSYFANFSNKKYNTIGAIVMNCNPFSKGHRYLIERAKQQVEFLIIFVVQEDLSLFSFEERYKMIVEGTKDISNVMVVPSGEFILSQNNFKEYFTKEEDKLVSVNAEYDINVFADYIAKPLCITHRFAGEEPEDKVTSIYNTAMEKILPRKGITFVKIPRIEIEGEVVSASKMRKYLEEEDYDRAFKFTPDTTKQHLLNQISI